MAEASMHGRDRSGSFPWMIALYTAALASAGIILGSAGQTGWTSSGGRWTTVPLVFLLAAAAAMIIRFHYGTQVMALDLFEAVVAVAIFALPGVVAVAVAAIGQLAAEILNRNRPLKSAFNVAQWMCAVGAGAAVFEALRTGSVFSGRTAGSIVAAMTAVAVVNTLAFSFVIRLAERRPILDVLRGLAPGILLGWVVNTAFGMLLVVSFNWSAAALALFVVPLGSLHWAYRGHAAALADRARLDGLHRASRALATPLDPRDAIPHFLAEARDCFRAAAVELLLIEDGGRVAHICTGSGYRRELRIGNEDSLADVLLRQGIPTRVTASSDPLLVPLLTRTGRRDAIAAPLAFDGRPAGVLCVYDRSGFEGHERGELVVLEALAREAADALQKGRLLSAIIEERRKLAEIVDTTSDGIVTFAPDGTVRSWNPGFEEISGFSGEGMVGSRGLVALQPTDSRGEEVPFERWATNGALPSEMHIVRRDGETRWISCSYGSVRNDGGMPGTLVVIVRDRTRARELERLKEDFVATVSHELRTPLTPIKGWAKMLLEHDDRLDDTTRKQAVTSIRKQAERLEELVVNLLEASRIERGGNGHAESSIDVSTAITKVVDDFRASYPDRIIRVRAVGPQALARGDRVWVERIIANLLSNATKYTPSDEPIDVRAARAEGSVVVTVSDRGPGIPPTETERIFERFHRLGDTLTRAQQGAGLGLYIARQLAEALGGTLTVSTRQGGGTTFTLSLRDADDRVSAGAETH